MKILWDIQGNIFFETQNHQTVGYYKSGDETIAMVFGTNPEDVLIMDLDGDGENELISQLVWGDGAEDVAVFKKNEGQIKMAYCSELLDEEYDNVHFMSCLTTLVKGQSQVQIKYWKEAEQKYYEKVYEIELDKLNFQEPVLE